MALFGTVSAQTDYPKIIPPSPNAASLGKYGEIPLNYSSGLPNINIPLFDLTEGALKLPVSINYNYSGYKPVEQPSLMGRGWSLMAGGIISRVVKDLPDEYISNGISGYLHATTQIKTLLNTDGTLNCTSGCATCYNSGQCDGEPDMFYFTFGNNSGKFFFGDDGLPHVVSDRKIKIAYNIFTTTVPVFNGLFDNIYGFTLTTEDGTVYKFGDPAKTLSEISFPIKNVEFSYSQNDLLQGANGAYRASISAWMLQEIDDVDGNKISFTYTNDYKDPAGGGFMANRQKIVVSPYQWIIKKEGQSINYDEKLAYNNYAVSSENLLTAIQGSNWKVSLSYNDLTDNNKVHTLSSIAMTLANGAPIKSYEAAYSSTDMACLLSTLKEKDIPGGATNKVYGFQYNPIPATFYPYGIDYWGYYNGVNNATMIPVSPYNANRDPSLLNTLCGALSGITYPTGGTTTFQYELNQYGYIRENATDNGTTIGSRPCGGIRVKTIINTANNGTPPVQKDFYYTNFGNPSISSGVILAPINSYFFTFNTTTSGGLGTPWSQVPDVTVNWQIYKSDPFFPLSTNPVYYFNVREKSGNTLQSDYTFTSHLDYPDELGVNYGLGDNQVGPFGSYDFIRPVEKDVKYYNGANVVYEKQTNYQPTIVHRARTLWRQIFFTQPGGSFQFIKGLSTISAFVQKVSDVTINSFPQTVTNTVNYTYDPSYYALRTQTQSNSDNKTTVTNFKYPFDYSTSVYQSMVTSNILTPVIEQTSLTDGTQISHKTTNYSTFNGNLYKPATLTQQTTANGETFVATAFTGYTTNGNIKDILEKNAVKSAYIWGYNLQYPIVACKNASSNDIYYDGFEEGDGNSANGEAKTGHYSFLVGSSAYTKNLTGLDPGNYICSYWYYQGGAWLLQTTSVTVPGGGSYTITVPANTKLDDLRFYPADAQMTTYTYDPLVGITSITDAKGDVTSYEYDSFQRLVNIKDKDGNIVKHIDYHYQQ